MVSPAKAHFLRASAAALAAGAQQVSPDASQYELMLAKLAEDRRRLKDVQSIERKAEVKRELLPEYTPWIEGVLAGNSGRQDDVLVTAMIWRIDIGDIEGALPLARYVIAHQLAMPDQYKRTPACAIAEEAADMALKGSDIGAAPLLAVAALTAGEDMPDQVRAKLHKAIGYALEASDKAAALDHLQRALTLHDKVGVKKDIERIERDIKNSAG